MAGRITEFAALTGAGAADTDLVEVVDVSDTSMAATGTNKQMALSELKTKVGGGGGVIPGTLESVYRSGYYYPANSAGRAHDGGWNTNASVNISAGDRRYIPVNFAAATTLDRIVYMVGGATPAFDTRWALYASDGTDGKPGTLITDFGVHTTGGGNMQEMTIADRSVGTGLHWFGFQQSVNNGGTQYLYPPAQVLPVVSNNLGLYPTVYLQGGSFGAFPNPAGALAFSAGWIVPLVIFRVK